MTWQVVPVQATPSPWRTKGQTAARTGRRSDRPIPICPATPQTTRVTVERHSQRQRLPGTPRLFRDFKCQSPLIDWSPTSSTPTPSSTVRQRPFRPPYGTRRPQRLNRPSARPHRRISSRASSRREGGEAQRRPALPLFVVASHPSGNFRASGWTKPRNRREDSWRDLPCATGAIGGLEMPLAAALRVLLQPRPRFADGRRMVRNVARGG